MIVLFVTKQLQEGGKLFRNWGFARVNLERVFESPRILYPAFRQLVERVPIFAVYLIYLTH